MLNKVILMGRFTKDPELRSTSSGKSVCGFTLAADRNFVRQGEEKKADFISCVAWDKIAEFIFGYFKKGDMIAVEGSIQTRTWDDSDGSRRYATEVIVGRAYFCGGKRAEASSPEAMPSPEAAKLDSIMPEDDDLPF